MHEDLEQQLAASALAYPETREDHPWGERAFKVRGKMFLIVSRSATSLAFTFKLPTSHLIARELPFAEPTGYGLGRSGWITARFYPGDAPDAALLLAWLEQSYRAVAPKALVRGLDGG